jgi:dTDP-4-amino-4,6-dideoxygalactose transaminase
MRFKVKHAIACNSATSGLFAAAHAVGLSRGDRFICPALTMSATAAAPALTGATPLFCDVDRMTFILDPEAYNGEPIGVKAVFLTHLFGLAQYETWWKTWCDRNDCKLIVDAAQAPFAVDDGVLAGTAAHIGVYSLNVHKHIQCGEGGIVVTNDDGLALAVRRCINHGELDGSDQLGLNLRMTEVTAGIALVQLRRADELIEGRIDQAEHIIQAIGKIPRLVPPCLLPGARHIYYTLPFRYTGDRGWFVRALIAEGVPLTSGYTPPLYRWPVFRHCGLKCRNAETLHDDELFYFENCRYTPTPEQIEQIGDAFRKVASHADSRAHDRV